MKDAFELAPERWVRRASWILCLGFGGFVVWACLMPLQAGTVVAATLVVSKDAQVIAHREGGWIKAIHVADGDKVQQGQLLMEISDGRSAAELNKWQERVWQLATERARIQQTLDISSDKKTNLISQLNVPHEIKRHHQQLLAQQLLQHQLSAQELQLKLSGHQSELRALKVRHHSLEARKHLADEELSIARQLEQQAYLARMQLLAIERSNAELAGQLGASTAQQQALTAKISALMRQQERHQSQFEAGLLQRLSEVELNLIEAKMSLQNIKLQHQSGLIYALNDGYVAGLRAQSVATDQIWPGEVLMRLIPEDPDLVVEGLLPVTAIDNVWAGLTTKVYLRALDGALMAPVEGIVAHVDADPTEYGEERGYRFQVQITPAQWHEMADQRVMPGMPVDVFIQLRQSTLLRYLLEPILAHTNRALRES